MDERARAVCAAPVVLAVQGRDAVRDSGALALEVGRSDCGVHSGLLPIGLRPGATKRRSGGRRELGARIVAHQRGFEFIGIGIMRSLVLRSIRRPATVLLLCSALAGCGGTDEPSSVFGYDSSAPVRVEDAGRVNPGYPVAVRDVSFETPSGRVQAFLVAPPGDQRKPAVVYLHGQGGDRQELLVPATWLAARGAVALTLTAPSSAGGTPEEGLDELRRQRDLAVADVVAVRRALDLLAERADVDPERLGFVGYSAGARTGAVLAGVEPRLDAVVLMSAGASPLAEYVSAAPAAIREEVEAVLEEIDPLRYAAVEGDRAVLLQNGEQDDVVPRAALEAVADAMSGAVVRWYDAGHGLDNDAYREQLDWLTEELAITGPPVAGAETGP